MLLYYTLYETTLHDEREIATLAINTDTIKNGEMFDLLAPGYGLKVKITKIEAAQGKNIGNTADKPSR